MDRVPVFYLYLHRKLVLSYKVGVRLNYKRVMTLMARSFHIPKNVLYCLFKELESFGLVVLHNRLFLEVVNAEASEFVDDHSLLYRKVGIKQ